MNAEPTHISRVLSDGSTVSGYPEHVARAVAFDQDMRAQERAWIDQLRAAGVKAAHPDDGWVNRSENKVHLCYPQFNDGLSEGDLLALGWSSSQTRIVRVIGTSSNIFAGEGVWWWHFEEVPDDA